MLDVHSLLVATCNQHYVSAFFLYNLTAMERQQSSEFT